MYEDLTSQAVARRLFETTPTPIRDIAATVDHAERTIYRWAKRGGWKRFEQPRDLEELRRELSERLARFIAEDEGEVPREPDKAG
jgi:hypothetical protein